jgi:hypothetical protein
VMVAKTNDIRADKVSVRAFMIISGWMKWLS